MGKRITWTTETRKLSDLVPWDRNPRQLTEAQAEHIETSIAQFGLVDPPAINKDNTIIGGHQRRNIMELMDEYGADAQIDVRVPSRTLNEREVEELNIRLNKNTGSFDFDALANDFEVDDLLDWGFEPFELGLDDSYGNDVEDVEPQFDRAEELREEWGVELGQLWQLGDHRLICGDCTDEAVVERVMAGELAKMMVTDPPYGVGYSSGQNTGKYDSGMRHDDIKGDSEPAFAKDLMMRSFEISPLQNPAAIFVFHDARFAGQLMEIGGGLDWTQRAQLIWVKPTAQMSFTQQYHQQHEPFFYFTNGANVEWNGGGTERTVFEVGRDGDGSHPTMKPVMLIERLIKNHTSGDNELVYDPFLGSGSTLVACARLNRKCYGVEIEPKYVAVTLQRWVDATGKIPELIG